MQGYSPSLPLRTTTEDGVYALNKKIIDFARQNLKMVVLTVPGERQHDINFGVGLKRYTFEQDTEQLRAAIRQKIIEQVGKYLRYITINDIIFSPPDSNSDNLINIVINYSISSLNINDETDFTL